MEAKTYRVKSINEALDRIRQDLGPEASVLHTRRINAGLWSWLSGNRYEVVASNSLEVPDRFTQWLDESLTEAEDLVHQELGSQTIASLSDSACQTAQPNLVSAGSLPDPTFESLVSRQDESFEEFLGQPGHKDSASEAYPDNTRFSASCLADWSNRGEGSSVGKPTTPPSPADTHANGWDQFYAWLKSCDVESTTANLLCHDLKRLHALTVGESPSLVSCPDWETLAGLLGGQLRRGGVVQCRTGHCQRIALVGPTGVGKTTTLAKLAGEYRLRRGMKVGLITVDTYRVGAVDQLRAYANILKTPFAIVTNPQEMQAAVASMEDMDLVLIDTIGRSPGDTQRIHELQEVLRSADLDQIYLTLPAGSSQGWLQRSFDAYQYLTSLCQASMVITKVDECSTLASLYPFLKSCSLPWAYWTNGQNVPDDLGITREDVAVWFLDQMGN